MHYLQKSKTYPLSPCRNKQHEDVNSTFALNVSVIKREYAIILKSIKILFNETQIHLLILNVLSVWHAID